MYVCVRVCAYACVCSPNNVCVCAYVRVYVCACVHGRVCMRVRVCVCARALIFFFCILKVSSSSFVPNTHTWMRCCARARQQVHILQKRNTFIYIKSIFFLSTFQIHKTRLDALLRESKTAGTCSQKTQIYIYILCIKCILFCLRFKCTQYV